MNIKSPDRLRGLARDIEMELAKLSKLEGKVQRTQQDIEKAPEYAEMFYESLALKFHNFYTGCERIFSLIAVDLNGGVPKGSDWHKRLLNRMADVGKERIAVIMPETAKLIQNFLSFRHVVRNIYGYELEIARVDALLELYPATWNQFEKDITSFVNWLRELALSLDKT